MIDVQLKSTPLHPEQCREFVSDAGAGAIVEFIGTVRLQTQGREVTRLEFEAYAPMALSEMQKIAGDALQQFALLKVSIHHRVGVLDISEIPVVISVSAPHRAAAFAGCQYCIDTLKETVPIWKKEVFTDGETWVAAHP
ncbi:MAG: molybdenum cofactor biosynthesis protein MoaE [Bacteroidetes bacterium]|nr:MAG: molybdenum cofactor biosynthesis protein MoaE [Bacteroidota bacterium]